MEEKEQTGLNLKTRSFEITEGDSEPRVVTVQEDDMLAIFRGMRPRNMSYDDFKAVQKLLKKELAQYLKGTIVHLSKVSDQVWSDYTKGKHIKQKGHTYVKSRSNESSGEASE